MTKARWLALGAATLALAACNQATDNKAGAANGSAAAAVAPPAGQDWTQVVSETPEGGFRMGNPNARVKLVEYASLTCGHCAEFSESGGPKLQEYVKKGTVSLEIRDYLRSPFDALLVLTTRCQGPGSYFALTEQALAQQNAFLGKAQNIDNATAARLQGLAPADQFKELARVIGADQFAKQRGISEAKLDACLSDKASLDKLVEMQKYANETAQIPGTPAFIMNGQLLQNAGTWETLEPQLRAAGA
jgi:protein-disulfide isomerase